MTTIPSRLAFIEPEKISEAPLNPNIMRPEEAEALRRDMEIHGPSHLTPIIIARIQTLVKDAPGLTKETLICVDGHKRLAIARELKWAAIPTLEDPTIHTLQDTLIQGYLKNRERGEIDAFKEAEFFKWLQDQGKTQKEIAKLVNVDQTQISKRLSLLKVDSAAKDILMKLPEITASHLEVIATAKPEMQKLVATVVVNRKEAWGNGTVTVQNLKQTLDRKVEEAEERAIWQKIITESPFPKCPTCTCPPDAISEYRLPWFIDRRGHSWHSKTGKLEHETAAKENEPAGTKREAPDYLRTLHTKQDFEELTAALLRAHYPQIASLSHCNLHGKTTDGQRFSVDVTSAYSSYASYAFQGFGEDLTVSYEPKEYATKSLKEFKGIIHVSKDPKKLATYEKRLAELFRKYMTHVIKPQNPRKGLPRTSYGRLEALKHDPDNEE